VSPTRFLRDVFASVLATGIASVAFSHLMREPTPVQPVVVTPAGKVAGRLAWEADDLQDRSLRIAETVAMFSLPQADARSWSERSVAPAKQQDPVPAKPVSAKAVAMPQIAQIEARQHKMTPPSRPVVLASAEMPGTVAAKPEPHKEPIRVLGWSVPGSDLLPSGQDALGAVAVIGDTVASVGRTAEKLPGKVASLGSAVAETVGWR
jgi:hypothetical protein